MILKALKPLVPSPIRQAIRRLVIPENPPGARGAARLVDIKKANVLVAGANVGEECSEFIKLGAKEVHGIDVIEEVGRGFPHPRIVYHRESIERSSLSDQSFDLVFSFATMEHVSDIEAGYSEMARLVKPGGFIYSFASPLWHSPYGHHMQCFDGHPWVHLAFDRAGILDYANSHGIIGERGISIENIVDYMLDRRFFNMRRAAEYFEATASATKSFSDVENRIIADHRPALLDHPLAAKALANGHSRYDMLGSAHFLIARR